MQPFNLPNVSKVSGEGKVGRPKEKQLMNYDSISICRRCRMGPSPGPHGPLRGLGVENRESSAWWRGAVCPFVREACESESTMPSSC